MDATRSRFGEADLVERIMLRVLRDMVISTGELEQAAWRESSAAARGANALGL